MIIITFATVERFPCRYHEQLEPLRASLPSFSISRHLHPKQDKSRFYPGFY